MGSTYNKYHYTTADPYYYGMLKCYANENRNHRTPEEELLWEYLSGHQLGLHFRRQHIIGCYIADFVCLKKHLIIEVDGGYHAQERQQIKDYLRTTDLNKMGFKVLRFSNKDIMTNMSGVLDNIFNNLASPTQASEQNN